MARTAILSDAAKVQPRPDDVALFTEISDEIGTDAPIALRLAGGKEIVLPDAIRDLLHASVSELSKGHDVVVLALEVLLTPAETAELLGFSRPYVARLLDEELIASQYLPRSRHRVVRLADVLEFQAQRSRRREGRRRLAEAIEDLDLPY